MSQQAVERAIGKLTTDEGFREAFFADAARASLEAGLQLSAFEIDALRRISAEALQRFSDGLDDGICRLRPSPAAGDARGR
jgi:Ribosomally synthesized peptide prototyped by Frankia Franean1_4349.